MPKNRQTLHRTIFSRALMFVLIPTWYNSSLSVATVLGVTEISAIVAAAGVLVGVAYYILDMRNQSRMRMMDFIMRMPSSFIKRDIFETLATVQETEYRNWDEFEEKCGIEARQVSGWCEDLGLLVKRKVVDSNLVAERYDVTSFYEKLRPWIEESRRRANNDPHLYEWFEYLYNETKRKEQQRKSA